MVQLTKGWGDIDTFSDDERLLTERSLNEVLRVAAARAVLDAEEETAAISTRPTIPVFLGEPWR